MRDELIFALDDQPGWLQSSTAAAQHVLASFAGIITPTLIIGAILGLEDEIPYLISMSLFVSGVATYVQARTIGPVGAGLIAVQGTSFAFLGAIVSAGLLAQSRGGGAEEMLALIFGVCFFGAFVEIVLSQFIDRLRRIVTPLVTGIVITSIGLSLIQVAMTNLAGGNGEADFASPFNLLLGGGVLLLIITLSALQNPWLRMSAIVIGMLAGTVAAWWLGHASFATIGDLPLFAVPQPFKYGFDFDFAVFLPIALIYLLTALETTGDLTANSLFCGLPVKGPAYIKRIRAGILGDGINSLIAATFNTFPNTTFGQNNAVIQMTGIAARKVGYYIAALLVILGLFPVIGGIVQAIPNPVLGGATLVMFGTIAAAGIRIIASEPIDRRKTLIIATSLGLGLGVMMVPGALQNTPDLVQQVFGSAITTSGLTAIVMVLLIPDPNRSLTDNATGNENQ